MQKISIIIPAYNGEKFLPRSIGSVLAQTYTDWELIVVDDGSTDGTKKVVEEFVKKDPRISYHYEENSGGPAKPKNTAWQYARGEYIAYLDQDDEWLPEKLEKQVDVLERDGDKKIGLVTCDALLAGADGEVFGKYANPRLVSLFPALLMRDFIYSNSSVLLRRGIIEKIGPRDERLKYTEDWDMWIRIVAAGYNIGFVREPLFKYFVYDANATKTMGYLVRAENAEYVFAKHRALYEKYNYVHVGLFRLGVMFFLAGDIPKSRRYFAQSIKKKKIFIPAYCGYVFSFLGGVGVALIKTLIWFYRILHGKTYLVRSLAR